MTLQFTSEQLELRDQFQRFLKSELSPDYIRKRISQSEASDPNLQRKLEELGIRELFCAKSEDGGAGYRELSLLAYEAGYYLLTEPLVDLLFAGPVLFWSEHSQNFKERQDFQKKLSENKLKIGIVPPLHDTSAAMNFTAAADHADYFLLFKAAQAFLAPNSKQAKPAQSIDSSLKVFQLNLSEQSSWIPVCPAEQLRFMYLTLKASELCGAAVRCIDMTKEYVKTRKQFDLPVGSFQAVQHKLSDMYLKSEALRALCEFSAWSAMHSQEQFKLAAQSAIFFACESAPWIAESALQLHGGIAFTWEYDLHLYLRRIRFIESLYQPQSTDYMDFIRHVQA